MKWVKLLHCTIIVWIINKKVFRINLQSLAICPAFRLLTTRLHTY